MSGLGLQSIPAAFVGIATTALAGMRNLLLQISQATCQINLVKSATAPNAANSRHLDMTVRLANELKEAISASLELMANSALSTAGGVAEFNFQAFADGRLAALPINQYQKVQDWLAKFPARDVVQALKTSDDHIANLKFIETVLVFPNGEIIRAFRRSSGAKIATKGGVIANLTGAGYDYVESNRPLLFDTQVDFFVWDNFIYVPSYKDLEAVLSFREITRSIASDVCDGIFAMLPVTHGAELRLAVFQGTRHLNKMAGLKNKAHLQLLDMQKIQGVITKAGLPITIVNLNGVQTLDVDPTNPDHIKAYLHILGDDYVESMMTALHYIGIEKEQI